MILLAKLVSAALLLVAGCLAFCSFRAAAKRDALKQEFDDVQGLRDQLEIGRERLMTIALAAIRAYQRARLAWGDSQPPDRRKRIETTLELINVMKALGRPVEDEPAPGELASLEQFDKIADQFAQAQDAGADRLATNSQGLAAARSLDRSLRARIDKATRRVNLVTSLMHVTTILALVVAMFGLDSKP
jgi:hypothetical protein